MRPCCPSDWTACSSFMSLFRWKHCTFPTMCPFVSRGKHDVPAWFGTGGAVPPSRVLPFSKAKRSGDRFMWGSPPSKMGDDARSRGREAPLSSLFLCSNIFCLRADGLSMSGFVWSLGIVPFVCFFGRIDGKIL